MTLLTKKDIEGILRKTPKIDKFGDCEILVCDNEDYFKEIDLMCAVDHLLKGKEIAHYKKLIKAIPTTKLRADIKVGYKLDIEYDPRHELTTTKKNIHADISNDCIQLANADVCRLELKYYASLGNRFPQSEHYVLRFKVPLVNFN